MSHDDIKKLDSDYAPEGEVVSFDKSYSDNLGHDDPNEGHVSLPMGRREGNIFERMLYWEQVLDSKLGIESNAVERILPDRQTGTRKQLMLMSVFWASCTMVRTIPFLFHPALRERPLC